MSAAYAGPDCELRPDPTNIAAFCRWWFEYATKGVLEIGWLDAAGRGLIHFEQFDRDDIDALVATAVQANIVPGQACYIRAATIHPRGESKGYTTDLDFIQSPGIWGDVDTLEDFERASTVQTMVRPNAVVFTGHIPHKRVQSWFRCTEPINDPEMVKSLNVRLHKLYGGDSSVINPSRLMRLPGTIAWPWKAGRVPEVTQFVRPTAEDGRPSSYPLSLLQTQLPRDEETSQKPQEDPFDFGFNANLSTVASHIAAIKGGRQWHNHMVRLTAKWVGMGRPTVEIMGHCADWTLPGFKVAQTRKEVMAAIDGARQKWGVPDSDTPINDEPAKPFGSTIFDPWGELDAPAFPIHALPGVIRNYVESRARIMGADPCAMAWSALSACSAALDGRTRLRMKRHDTWMVPPPLWVALVGEPSTKKTPIFQETWRPLEMLQNVAIRAYTDQKIQWDRLPKDEKANTEPPPKPTRLISNDATMESLQEILAGQDRGVAMFFDELATFIGGMDKYTNGKGGSERGFYLRAYTGGPHVVDRVGRGIVAVNNLLMTICGGIQPERLASFKDLMDDGLWQRFIPIITTQADLGTDESDAGPVEDYTLRLQGIVEASNGHIASMSVDAHAIRAEMERELFRLERLKPMGSKFSSFIGKLPGIYGRLCLVLSYIEPHGMGYVISRKTAEQARTLIMKCVIPHAVNVYMTMGEAGAPVESLRVVASFILARKLTRLVVSDLTTGVRVCRGKTVQDLVKMISPLVAGGWLLPENELPGNRAWLVNPALQTTFGERAETERKRRSALRELIMSEPGDEEC